MRRLFHQNSLLVFLFLFLTPFCYTQTTSVKGIIRGADGFLQGATVSVGQAIVLTDKAGQFSIDLPPGHYTIEITHVGHKKITQQITIKAGPVIWVELIMAPDEKVGEVVTLGSRSSVVRSNLATPVPVDLISSNQLLQTSQTSLTQMLDFSAPSFNASRQLLNEPITLRGLDPDQVLILVNGRRYQNMAAVNTGGVRGTLGRGAVSNDLNSIPFCGVEKVEILRDGASAQYGSDAISGVINIRLKNSIEGTWVQTHTGQFYEGDGATISIGINQGAKIFKKGFLNVSGSFRFQNPTYRGGEYEGTVYRIIPANAGYDDSLRIRFADDSIVNARNFDRNKVSNAGTSKHTAWAFSMNGAYPTGQRTELFWTIIMNHRISVFTSGFTFPKNANRINPELFPDGFGSHPSNHTNDIFAVAGFKCETKTNWHWEASSAFGTNWSKWYNEQTNNASQYLTLGKNAPTSFYTGSLAYSQLANDVEFSKKFFQTTGRVLNLALGAEWRVENDQLKDGEEASWKTYDTTGRKLGGSGGLMISPQDKVQANRKVAAAYMDVESEFLNCLLIDIAGRFEYYSDFGGNASGKLATRYKLNDKFAVRASISNGFRAPSLQQHYYSQTRVGVSSTASGYFLVTNGIFRNGSQVTGALGIPSLQAEKSVNLSGGLTGMLPGSLRLTADVYWIQIKNRIVLSGVFDRTINRNLDSLLQGLTDVTQVQFFVNAINTRTKGLDIVLNGSWRIKKSSLFLSLGANFTQTRLFGQIKAAGNLKADSLNSNTLFNVEERTRVEHGQPENKIILSLTYSIGKVELLIRNTRFGKTAIAPAYIDPQRITTFVYESFSPRILTDLSITYSPRKWLSMILGARNIFDVYPSQLKDFRNTGEGAYIYSQEASPFGFNGAYYFLSLGLKL